MEIIKGLTASPKIDFLSRNLFDFLDKNGKPNDAHFLAIEALDRELAQYPWFLGLVAFGSSMFGYSDDVSDVDVYVLVDESVMSTIVETLEKPSYLVHKAMSNVTAKTGVVFHKEMFKYIYPNLEPEHLLDDYMSLSSTPVLLLLWSSQGGGDGKIGEIRKNARKSFETMDNKLKMEIKNRVLSLVSVMDKMRFSSPKFKERLLLPDGPVTDQTINKLVDDRKILWSKRFKEMYGF